MILRWPKDERARVPTVRGHNSESRPVTKFLDIMNLIIADSTVARSFSPHPCGQEGEKLRQGGMVVKVKVKVDSMISLFQTENNRVV